MNKRYVVSVVCVVIFATASIGSGDNSNSEKVSSLSEVPGKIHSKDGSTVFNQQMDGATLPDGFGTCLPKGISSSRVVGVLLPNADVSLATLVGMKKWPYSKNTYIAIACIAPDKESQKRALQYNNGKPIIAPWLKEDKSSDFLIGIGIVTCHDSDTTLLLEGKLSWSKDESNPLAATWKNSNLDAPVADEGRNILHIPEEYYKFDFAKFKISKTTIAFGIRSGINEGYAGGGANFQFLSLFAMVDGELRMIFSEPIYFYKNLAGEWHDDGTRNHEVSEGENIIIVSNHSTNNHYDLIVKSKNENWQTVFHWDISLKTYVPRQREE